MVEENSVSSFKAIIIDEDLSALPIRSFIRNTSPDFILVVKSFTDPLSNELTNGAFRLNYGDLFLSTVNAVLFPQQITDYIDYLSKHLFLTSDKDEKDRIKQALLFTKIISSVNDGNPANRWLTTSLKQLINYPFNGLTEIKADQLTKNLNKSDFFSNISLKIHYKMISDDSSQFDLEEYSFKSFSDLLSFDIRRAVKRNQDIKVCQNCNRFFIPANRKDEKYCGFAFQGFKSCKQFAFSHRLSTDEILKTYRRIYKTQNARKQRNSHRPNIATNFDNWAAFAKQQLIACQNGEISITEMEKAISGSEWMNNSSM